MPIFEDLDIEFKLDTLTIIEHTDRFLFFTEVEPYIIPVFFKIDGEQYSATISILNTLPAEEGTTQVVEPTAIQFSVRSSPEHSPTIFTPPGPLLFDESLEDGDVLDVSNIAFTTTLQPIPLVIDILGVFDLRTILEALAAPIVDDVVDGVLVSFLNLAFDGISTVLGTLLGLDETLESCPDLNVDSEDFINAIEAEMNSLIPGTVGGVFVVMENDSFREADALTIQNSMRREITTIVNDITDSITRVNPIPDIDPNAVDTTALGARIVFDLLFRFDTVLWMLVIGPLWRDLPDDFVGFHLQTFDHMTIDRNGDNAFSRRLIEGGNTWDLAGTVQVT